MFDCISDTIVKWEVYNNETVCKNFPYDDWLLIASDIKNDDEWRDFVNEYGDFVKCYILRNCSNDKEVGFVYLYNESGNFDVVSIHGGGWGENLNSVLLYYRGMILIIDSLLNNGVKVRTNISVTNLRALRFMRSLGFVTYKTTDNVSYMWINKKRLQSSKIYKYLMERDFKLKASFAK